MADAGSAERPVDGLERSLAVTAAWLALAHWLVPLCNAFVPREVKANVSLQTFLMTAQILTMAIGVGLTVALLRAPRAALGIAPVGRPQLVRALGVTAFVAPAVFCASAAIAFRIALPTLLAEIDARGTTATRQNAGAFGQMMSSGPLLVTLVWGGLLAATTEELLFRGSLFSTLARLAEPLAPRVADNRWLRTLVVDGYGVAIVVAVVFGAMHADMPGGVGIMRVASTTVLGLASGFARARTGTIYAGIALHFLNNTIALGGTPGWFTDGGEPVLPPVTNTLLAVAATGLVVLAVALFVARLRARRAEQERALSLPE